MVEQLGNKQSNVNCPLCGSSGLRFFYEITDVPASCNRLWSSREAAVNCPKGNIKLAFCSSCTFVLNMAIEQEKNQYGSRYDNSLFYSKHFQNFARGMAINLIQRFDLHHKNIVEVGGGKVDFLSQIVELGDNRGIRLNPYNFKFNDRSKKTVKSSAVDFVFSYHELEHVNDPKKFLIDLRKKFGGNANTYFFFAVPNALKAFEEGDFTDVMYEHVSYFTIPSLSYLFSSCGFNILEINESKNEIFDSFYITATPSDQRNLDTMPPSPKKESARIQDCVLAFADRSRKSVEEFNDKITKLLNEGKHVAIWGAGARGVTLLNMLKDPRIEYAIDINPKKQGKYIPGTGQKIVSPKFISKQPPDYIILANPAYEEEIRQILIDLKISPEFIFIQ